MTFHRRALVLSALCACACASTVSVAPSLSGSAWVHATTREALVFNVDGTVDVRDERGYPPPPPVHTSWAMIWRPLPDGSAELAYDGRPERVVASAHRVAHGRMEFRYSASAINVYEPAPPPPLGRWRDIAEGRVLVFAVGGRMLYGSSVNDGPWPATCCPHMIWRLTPTGYEIVGTNSEAGAAPDVFVSKIVVDGNRMRLTTPDRNYNLTLERLDK